MCKPEKKSGAQQDHNYRTVFFHICVMFERKLEG